MAPEAGILKRQRLRPSEWWAIPPLQPSPAIPQREERQPQVQDASPKRKTKSSARVVSDVGEGGESKKGRPADGAARERAVRRGRSSGGEVDFAGGVGENSIGVPAKSKYKGKTIAGKPVQKAQPVRKGRSSAGEAELRNVADDENDELVSAEDGKQITPKSSGRERKRPGADSPGREEQTEDELGDGTSLELRSQPTPVKAPKEAPKASKQRSRPGSEVETTALALKKKRPRLSEAEVLEQESTIVSLGSTPGRGRTRTRPSDAGVPASSKPMDQKRFRETVDQPEVRIAGFPKSRLYRPNTEDRGRTRTRRSEAELEREPIVASSQSKNKQTKPNRRSEIIEVEAATSKLIKNRGEKRPKPSSNPASKASKSFTATQPSRTLKGGNVSSQALRLEKIAAPPSHALGTGTKRSSQAEDVTRKRKDVEVVDPPDPAKRRRVSKISEQIEHDEPEAKRPSYRHLAAVTRRVSRQVIDTKWEALPPACVDRISQLFHDIQRPVLVQLHDEKKKTQAISALQMISRRLVSKISRGLPFPPGTRNHREDDFDFEKILDHNRALEAQLTPALHSNELLEAELRKEVARLDADRESLATLEANAKTEAGLRSQAARKLHAVLQSEVSTAEVEALQNSIGLVMDQRSRAVDLNAYDDESLQTLQQELDCHVDTIEGNVKQLRGISQAMAMGRAAVQAKLFDHLDSTQYDEVVLGLD